MIWLAYLCAVLGHVREGVGYGTDPGSVVWSSVCARCGEKVCA